MNKNNRKRRKKKNERNINSEKLFIIKVNYMDNYS